MPADYKYEHISTGRLKALSIAAAEFSSVYRQLKKSEVVAPSVMDRLRIIGLLLNRATGGPISLEDQGLLEQILGKDLGIEKQ